MKALEIDDSLAETHAALGLIRMDCDWDWPGAENEFKRALEINPNYGTARLWYGQYFEATGRPEECVAERRRALQAEPLSLIFNATLGRALFEARHHDQAIEQLQKTVDLDPSFIEARLYLGSVYEQKGRLAEAIAEFRQAVDASGGGSRYVSALGHAYAISGQRKVAEESLVQLKERARQRYVAPYNMAAVYMGLKDKEQTLKYLGLAYTDRSFGMIALRADPRFDGIRGEPRYQDLLRRMHLTP
jgi:tetratricopeptide (TPR) repeat protein